MHFFIAYADCCSISCLSILTATFRYYLKTFNRRL